MSYAATAAYAFSRWPIFGLVPSMGFDTQKTSDRNQGTEGQFSFPGALEGFQLYNAFLALTGENWDASFTVRNLTDERNQIGANFLEETTFTIGRPRAWLLRIGYRM